MQLPTRNYSNIQIPRRDSLGMISEVDAEVQQRSTATAKLAQVGAKRSLSPSLRSTKKNHTVDTLVPATTSMAVAAVESVRNTPVGSVTISTARPAVSSRKMPAYNQVAPGRSSAGPDNGWPAGIVRPFQPPAGQQTGPGRSRSGRTGRTCRGLRAGTAARRARARRWRAPPRSGDFQALGREGAGRGLPAVAWRGSHRRWCQGQK
jgi:hypothetical protein